MGGFSLKHLRLEPLRNTPWLRSSMLLVLSIPIAVNTVAAAADGPTGEEICKAQCASCHGANGQGVEEFYPDPLYGDRPLEDLIQVIDETMPEDDPERCRGPVAKKAAEYISETFYTAGKLGTSRFMDFTPLSTRTRIPAFNRNPTRKRGSAIFSNPFLAYASGYNVKKIMSGCLCHDGLPIRPTFFATSGLRSPDKTAQVAWLSEP